MINFSIFDYIELLSLERPFLLILVFLPLLLMLLKRFKMHALSNYADKHLWPWSINISEQYFRSRKLIQMIGWLLIAIALAGPKIPGFTEALTKHNKNVKSDISIILITDINGISKSDFNTYIIKISDFIDKLNGEKIGFVALNSKSALISPLTNDYNVSYFYLRQMFDVINLKSRSLSNDLYSSLLISYKEIKASKATSGVVVYWSDYLRNKISNKNLIKVKILIEELEGQNITVIPIWNNSNESGMKSDDITEIFGDLSNEYLGQSLENLYADRLSDIKSSTLFDTSKNHNYQQLFSYPLIIGLIILLISFVPFQILKKVKN